MEPCTECGAQMMSKKKEKREEEKRAARNWRGQKDQRTGRLQPVRRRSSSVWGEKRVVALLKPLRTTERINGRIIIRIVLAPEEEGPYRNAAEMTQYGVRNNTTFLECLPKPPQASIRWLIHRDNDRRKEVKLSDRVVSTEHGLLIRSVQLSDQGLYYCLTTENGFKRTVAKIRVRVLSEAMVSVLTDKQQSPWAWASSLHPKTLLAAFSPAESLAVQQYCKERKQLQALQQQQTQTQTQTQAQPPGPLRGDLAKLKPLLDRRKSRNRRYHVPELTDAADAAAAASSVHASMFRHPAATHKAMEHTARMDTPEPSKALQTTPNVWIRDISSSLILSAVGSSSEAVWYGERREREASVASPLREPHTINTYEATANSTSKLSSKLADTDLKTEKQGDRIKSLPNAEHHGHQ
ncbi:Semaphorin-3C [Liparis tanakae]|uniref:Semaphorin-3C n=1 Tax=Liparis tanakae TaxID=230148 RepID=A0A4Z2HSM6_9TELE|nr:Semaphorin-3C [Liparis tanakae]